MAYEIRSIEYHEAARRDASQRNHRRVEEQLDLEDCALSSWADGQMQRYHSLAIALLENGKVLGTNGPAAEKLILWDTKANEEVDAQTIRTQYGTCWLLDDDPAGKFGRRFIPIGKRSRVQKQLGLEERHSLRPCSRWLRATCAGVGMPVSLHPQFDE